MAGIPDTDTSGKEVVPSKLILLVVALVIFHLGVFSSLDKAAVSNKETAKDSMMLTAVQRNPSPSVFSHIPDSSPPSMDADCETNNLRHASNSTPMQIDKPDGSSPNYQGGIPQMIPVAMVPPPHILIGPGGNYTILPSLANSGDSTLGELPSMQTTGEFSGGANNKTPLIPTPYYGSGQSVMPTPSSTEDTSNYLSLVSTAPPHSDPQAIHQGVHSHSEPINPPQTCSPVEIKPPFLHVPSTTSSLSGDVLLDRGASSSDPQLSEHHGHAHCEGVEVVSHRRRRKRHSHHRHKGRRQNSGEPDLSPGEESEGSPMKAIKEETDHTPSCSKETLETSETGPVRPSYPVQALVDVPMNPPLTRSSRTSSLSSSLSSFRFGGSLSQLWASQMSLTGRLPNMKSTGNLNAETATMPSLGNQYFAFGGSLPELSLTSLSRLLPNSATSDTNISSCPGLFTLLHPPLYVYPSQQHLTTPFINANGSITFGSFLSGGSSLCSAQKATPPPSGDGDKAAENGSTQASSTSIITGTENKVTEGGYDKIHDASSPSSSNGVKVPMFTPVASSLIGPPHVLTALPAFHTITSSAECTMSHSSAMSSPIYSTSTPMAHSVTSSPPQVAAPNLDTLACVATTPHHQLASPVSPHSLPQHHIIHTSTGGSPHNNHMQALPHMDSKDGILGMSGHYMTVANRPGVIQSSGPIPMTGVKLESEPCITPSPVKLSQGSPHAIPVISMPISECLGSDPLPPHAITPSQAHLPQGSGLETSPKREKDKPYKCDHPGCDRSFSFPAHLRSHVQQIHISYRPCKCDFPGCGKRFYTPQHLNVHRRVHTGERPFICPYTECSKAFTTAGNLKNHIRTHTGERPYSCKFDGCTKCFAEMSSLKKHELTHTGEKPYKCRVCGKAFSQAGSRNTHERKHSRTSNDGEGDSKGPRRFRIKRIPSSETPAIKAEPLL